MNAPRTARGRLRKLVPIWLVLGLLLGLPIAVWLDLRDLSEASLQRQARDLNSIITSVRSYYANNVVSRVLTAPGGVRVVHNYEAIPGAIPIPATLSLELGDVVKAQQSNVTYRFISDYPFEGRAPHEMDAFERDALATLRADSEQLLYDVSASGLSDRVRVVAPIIMGSTCVDCHNSHPASPKRDWKIGDVRGIQEIVITQPIAANIFSFKYLLIYFVAAAAIGFGFIFNQSRQAAVIERINNELAAANDFLTSISTKISRYLSPQIYRRIFSGEADVTIHTERKKLTIFFSDIKDFTAATERLQPEESTRMLNEYFTEMSVIAIKHGGTIDKFIGDAIVIFFGDPDTRGTQEDARSCLRMAVEMQRRLAKLNSDWRDRGVEQPFRVRMGISTGFCNVGNFGSADRMDYTIHGSEANLAARLQSIAEPGQIVMSYETYALVREIVVAHPLPALTMKGIGREVVPYIVEGMLDRTGQTVRVFSEHSAGLDFYLDPHAIDEREAERIRMVLQDALSSLADRPAPGHARASSP
ncbi:MAG TPA: adenylate/guanylate cyclase domain-containing protein [Alphaproteobacteria bacterium]|nr:adenylate/guanylate cyclase domain-containing protein [Alphaproteobacteria bacterium]